MGIRVLSLFDGISCGQVALERAGIEVSKYYASEIDKNAIKVTMENYPDTIQLGNVENLKGSKLPEIDLLIGGSPCQNLSQAMKKRDGLEGEKSKLFFEYMRLLEEVDPEYFLFENVGGMRLEDRETITKLLGVEPIRINSSEYSAQLRNRLYWTNIPYVVEMSDRSVELEHILEYGYTDRKKSRCLLESDSRPLSTPLKMFHRYYSTGFTTIVFKNEDHFLKCKSHYEQNFKNMSAKDIDNTGITSEIYDGVRVLSQLELERLQTLPEGYTSILKRNEAASVIGNGWTVDVIAHILKNIKY